MVVKGAKSLNTWPVNQDVAREPPDWQFGKPWPQQANRRDQQS